MRPTGTIAQALSNRARQQRCLRVWQAVIATVQNDKERALALAHHAVDLNATSSSARLCAIVRLSSSISTLMKPWKAQKKRVELALKVMLLPGRWLAELQMSAN